VALTGASGFVGRKVLGALVRSYRVRALVRRPPTDAPHVNGLEWRALDLNLSGPLEEEALAGVTVLVHAAAYIPRDHRDSSLAETCFRVNALGTLALLEAAARAGVRRFIHLSTNIYALGSIATESSSIFPSPHSPHYLLSKACGDIYTLNTGLAGSMQTVSLRLASIYGPGMAPRGLVPTFASRLLEGLSIRVHDGGRWLVDLVHVDDVVNAILTSVRATITGAINVGSGTSATSLDVARTLLELTGAGSERLEIDPPSPGDPLPGLPALDVSRARRELGYSPRTLRDGLADYLGSLRAAGATP
jgi:UDP-glucose 4-epimerase